MAFKLEGEMRLLRLYFSFFSLISVKINIQIYFLIVISDIQLDP